ncbi:MAG: bifunctional riboflavin kinase/FAD synthetase [Chthonomonadales bacterium]
MEIWRGLGTIRHPFEASAVAIGVFDGIHLGHQALINAAVRDARAAGRPAVVFTFDRHPAELINPLHAPPCITPPTRREELMRSTGADHLVVARFDTRFRSLSPEAFLRFVLAGVLGCRSVFVGPDFRFGCDQAGTAEYLVEAGSRLAFAGHVIAPVMVDGERVSSTRIRELIQEGSVERASEFLGRPYALEGSVTRGDGLGKKLGFPTANIRPFTCQVIPGDGVYAAWVLWRGARYLGACSIGTRPTVGGTDRRIEVHVLDLDADLYGERLEVEFVARVRGQERFPCLEDLVERMQQDVVAIRRVLHNASDGHARRL